MHTLSELGRTDESGERAYGAVGMIPSRSSVCRVLHDWDEGVDEIVESHMTDNGMMMSLDLIEVLELTLKSAGVGIDSGHAVTEADWSIQKRPPLTLRLCLASDGGMLNSKHGFCILVLKIVDRWLLNALRDGDGVTSVDTEKLKSKNRKIVKGKKSRGELVTASDYDIQGLPWWEGMQSSKACELIAYGECEDNFEEHKKLFKDGYEQFENISSKVRLFEIKMLSWFMF